jgi:hypothetical protein
MHAKCEICNLEIERSVTFLKVILSCVVYIHFVHCQKSVIFVFEISSFPSRMLTFELGCGFIAFEAGDYSEPICVGNSFQLYTPRPRLSLFNLLQPLDNCRRAISDTRARAGS